MTTTKTDLFFGLGLSEQRQEKTCLLHMLGNWAADQPSLFSLNIHLLPKSEISSL